MTVVSGFLTSSAWWGLLAVLLGSSFGEVGVYAYFLHPSVSCPDLATPVHRLLSVGVVWQLHGVFESCLRQKLL